MASQSLDNNSTLVRESMNIDRGGVDPKDFAEAKEFLDVMNACTRMDYIAHDGMPVYIMSMEWFKRWRAFSNLDKVLHKTDARGRGSDLDADGGAAVDVNNIKLSIEGSAALEPPGEITNEDILEDERVKVLRDNDGVKAYTNCVLRPGLLENKHYIILPQPVWRQLYSKYGGTPIRRYIVSESDENNTTMVEVYLKKVMILFGWNEGSLTAPSRSGFL